jgi:hypothetical protein
MMRYRALFQAALFLGGTACSEPQNLDFLDDLTDAGADAGAGACADAAHVGEVCSVGHGVCERAGTYSCARGELICDVEPGSPSEELCDTERDEDCDGEVDEAPEGACCRHEDCGELELCSRPAGDAFAAGTCMSFARPNADCTRDGGAVSCTCREGYYEDDGMCVRNACVPLEGEDPACAPNQSCEPTEPGEKACSCESGYDDCDDEEDNGCEQPLDVVDHCGGCDVRCDARASCSGGSEPRCVCDRPLIGDGSSCIGFGSIGAGNEITCGIRATGSIECFPASAPTPPSGSFKQLAVGFNHHCGLRADTTVGCWGGNDDGALNIPSSPPNQDYVQVVVGGFHVCALKSDGTPVCWGIGQTNPGSINDHGQSTAPSETFHQLAAGLRHTCGLRTDGSVRCWGAGLTHDAGCGQSNHDCGQGVPPDDSFVQLTAGLYHSCGLRADGTALCWGAGATDDDAEDSPNWGQLIVPSGAEFTFISAGAYHTCGVRTNRTVACWGAGQAGAAQLPADFGQSDPPAGDFLRVASGVLHTCGLSTSNQLRCWGGLNPQNLPQTATSGTWPVNP